MATKKTASSTPSKKSASAKAPASKAKPAPAKKAPAAKAPAAKKKAAPAPPKKAAAKAPAKKAPAAAKAPAKPLAKTPAKTPAKAPAKKAPAEAKKATAKAASGSASAAPKAKSPYDAKFLTAQREQLHTERANYVRQAEALMAEAVSLTENREPGDVQFDEESGEGDTLAVERERDLSLSAQARATIEEIDTALARIDANTYGICRVSGQPIPKERLRAIPWATERVEYKVGGFGRL